VTDWLIETWWSNLQAVNSFSSALASGQLGPLMRQFGLDEATVTAAQNGGLFVVAWQRPFHSISFIWDLVTKITFCMFHSMHTQKLKNCSTVNWLFKESYCTGHDNCNLNSHKYVCITTYQPDTKSIYNPNSNAIPNPATKQHAIVNIQLHIVTCPRCPDKFIRDVLPRLYNFRL